jgi:hypothetical protein
MKVCILCQKDELTVTFAKVAHTFPKSLGGESTCDNVCDKCNHYFGSPQSQSPAIEVILKEILNISKYLLLNMTNGIPKGKRYKSEFFNINWTHNSINLKPRYSLKRGTQEKFGRLFRRGLYKVFLEERENQRMDSLDSRFDFIREFARYDLSDYPIYYLKPNHDIILFSEIDTKQPMIRFTEYSDKMDMDFKIFEYQIMGHTFCIPTNRNFMSFYLVSYAKYLLKGNNPFGSLLIEIIYAENIDFRFKYMSLK